MGSGFTDNKTYPQAIDDFNKGYAFLLIRELRHPGDAAS